MTDTVLTELDTLDQPNLSKEMLHSFKTSFLEDWSEIRDYAEQEAHRLSILLAEIHQLIAQGETTEERAKIMLSIQSDVDSSHFTAIQGLGKAAIDTATKEAFTHVRQRVNAAIGFDLL